MVDGVDIALGELRDETLVQLDNVANPHHSDVDLGVAIVRSILLCWGWDFFKDPSREGLNQLGWKRLWQPCNQVFVHPTEGTGSMATEQSGFVNCRQAA